MHPPTPRGELRPRRRSPVLGLALGASALATAGCGDSVTAPAHDPRVTASAQPAAFLVGDSTIVTITVHTVGSRSRLVSVGGCEQPFTVTAGDSTEVPRPEYACLPIAYPTPVLGPGERRTFAVRRRGVTGKPYTHPGPIRLAAGPYRLRAFVRPPVPRPGADVADLDAVYAEPVSVQILPR